MNERRIRLEGRLDSHAIPTLEQLLAEATQRGDALLMLDMTRVTFLGSLGLRAVLVAARRLAASGGGLAVHASPAIAQVFAVSGIDRVVPVRETEAEAFAVPADGRAHA